VRILISGICGFVGSSIAIAMLEDNPAIEIVGCDNFSRVGSSINRETLEARGIKVVHADIRVQTDVDNLPATEWIIDGAANPSVLAGVDGVTSSRQVIESNLYGTVNLLEYAKKHKAGFILISTSRVYSTAALQAQRFEVQNEAFTFQDTAHPIQGISKMGISEALSTQAPISIYGSTKLCSEALILEYASAFDLPVWINRCGVIAGAGQFGRADQGIFTYWINAYLRQRPLKYVGFGGTGYQVRDFMHPDDLFALLKQQINCQTNDRPRIVNLGGGLNCSMSLKQLSDWCAERFGEQNVKSINENRTFDVPWVIMDYSLATDTWGWRPERTMHSILEEIAVHAETHPNWLSTSGQ
jgi:CDP-paratose 2-epimerase